MPTTISDTTLTSQGSSASLSGTVSSQMTGEMLFDDEPVSASPSVDGVTAQVSGVSLDDDLFGGGFGGESSSDDVMNNAPGMVDTAVTAPPVVHQNLFDDMAVAEVKVLNILWPNPLSTKYLSN